MFLLFGIFFSRGLYIILSSDLGRVPHQSDSQKSSQMSLSFFTRSIIFASKSSPVFLAWLMMLMFVWLDT